MFDKFKNLARLLSFIFVFNFLVLNFGIKPKEASASILNISSARFINFDLKTEDNYLIFDFLRYLSQNDTILEAKFKEGNQSEKAITISADKKSCKVRTVLIPGEKYELKVKANIDGAERKLLFNLVYDDQDFRFKPILGFYDNRLEVDLRKEFIDRFRNETKVVVDVVTGINDKVVSTVTKTVNELKSSSYKVVWQDAKKLFNDNSAYLLKVSMNGEPYKSKFYVVTESNRRVCKNLFPVLLSGTIADDGHCNLKMYVDVSLSREDRVSINSSPRVYGTITDVSKKHIDFAEVRLNMNNDYDIRLEKTNKEAREAKFSFCALDKIEKINCDLNVSGASNNALNVTFKNMEGFFSITNSNNKLAIYELNDFAKGDKIGENTSVSDTSPTCTVNLSSGKSFKNGQLYLIELVNSERNFTIGATFIYSPTQVSVSEVKETSAKISWSKPSGYNPASGDKVEIFLRDKDTSSTYSSIPNVALVHGNNNVNLGNTTFTVVSGLAPGTNYEAKIVINNQRGSATSFANFTTKPFVLTKHIEIKDAAVGDDYFKIVYPRSRRMTVEWDFNPENIQFSSGDKVEIWVKPNTTTDFSGYPSTGVYNNPVFTKTQNLNSTKSADITIPSWMTNFHVDLIYTIGGKKIITSKKEGEQGERAYNRRTVNAKVNKPKLEVDDITQTSVKVKWEYDNNNEGIQRYQPEKNHIVKLHMKKVNSLTDNTTGGFGNGDKQSAVFYYEHGINGEDILSKKEFDIQNLEVGQCYRLRLQHIIQHPGAFDDNYRAVEEYVNFKTVDFSIVGLKAEQQTTEDSRNIKLTWGTSGEPDFGEGGEAQNVKVYLKEGNTSEYPENSEETTIQSYSVSKNSIQRNEGEQQAPTPTKQCIINVPKYNTPYTAKVEYNLRGKKVEEHVLFEAKGDISLNISEIATNKAKITCKLPEGYVNKKESDAVKLTVVKKSTPGRESSDVVINKQNMSIESTDATHSIEENKISENDVCNVTVEFENKDKVVATASGSFKATSKFQIVDLNVSDIKATEAKLSWDFTPSGKLDSAQQDEKVEIYLKRNSPQKSASTDDSLTDFTKIYTVKQPNLSAYSRSEQENKDSVRSSSEKIHSKHYEESSNIKDFKKLDLKNLKVGEDYSIKVKYNATTSLSGDTDGVTEATFDFKTISDTFKATVFTSNQTTATYGWEYPPGYEIKEGDKVEIFVKDVTDGSEQSKSDSDGYGKALLTLVHGSDDGKYNLNEVTKVDVSGLTPERKYKSKIVFTMSIGHTTETEVDISTKSFEIKSFEVDSYEEYDILVKWEIEPQNMMFNESDKLEIFVKLASSDAYPADPSYKLTTDKTSDGKTISDTFSDYVLAESIGVEQNMKLVYTVGDKKYEKELTFTNNIDPLQAKVFSVDETRALIEVTPPSNYEFVNGDKLLIYAKDEFSDGNVQNDNFLVFEGVQSDTLSIADDMKLIELSYLLPEANYDIIVALDLLDGSGVEPVKLQLVTEPLPITDIKLESINYDGSTISWNYGENEIDFYKDENDDFTDKLLVGVKESDGTPIPDDFNAIRKIAVEEHSGQDIANVKDAKITVEDKTKDYDVAVCCDIGGLSYIKKTKLSFLSVLVDETSVLSDGAKVVWKYPSNINFGDSDKTEVFVRKKNDPNYPESPAFSSTGSGSTSYNLEGLEGSTEYIVKVQITKEGLQIDPVEAEFTTRGVASSEVIMEEPEYEITGTAAEIAIPNAEELDIDTEQAIGLKMGDEEFTGFSIKFNESGTAFTIEPTIPKKKYENIEVEIPLKDGTTFKMVIKEFVTQPADVAQDWLSNAYSFAFERFPDEGGYGYWYNERIKKKTLNGEYFLKNLLFAEDEFTNRNLQDKELIAALYQIVVNREYDEEGLNFWVGIYNENLQNAEGNKKLAQEVLVDRMAHEPEFGRLCDSVGIFWRQSDQDAAGVPS